MSDYIERLFKILPERVSLLAAVSTFLVRYKDSIGDSETVVVLKDPFKNKQRGFHMQLLKECPEATVILEDKQISDRKLMQLSPGGKICVKIGEGLVLVTEISEMEL